MKIKNIALIMTQALFMLFILSACAEANSPLFGSATPVAAPPVIEQETDDLQITQAESASPTLTADLWKTIYSEVIRRGSWEYNGDVVKSWFGVYYAIHDIDQNGIPELILGPRLGGDYLPIILYTIIDGELIVIDNSLDCDFGRIYNPSPGVIEVVDIYGAGDSYVSLEHLQISDGVLVDKYVWNWKRKIDQTDYADYVFADGTIISTDDLWDTISLQGEIEIICVEEDELDSWEIP